MDMDLLVMRLTPWHVMRPQHAVRAVRELLDLLQEKDGFQANRPLIIHGFSIAAMAWTLILMEMDQRGGGYDNVANTISTSELCLTTDGNCEDKAEDRSSADASRNTNDTGHAVSTGERRPVTAPDCPADHPLKQRLLGVVLDSPIQFDSLLPGLPNSMSRRPCIKRLLRRLLTGYFRLFSRSVVRPLSRMQEAFLTLRPPCPVLMFYSTPDKIVSSALLDAVVEKWRGQGWELHVRKWDDTPHVAHFRFHREEYEEELRLFMERIGLGKEGEDPGAMNGSGPDIPKS